MSTKQDFSATPDNRYAWTKIGDVHAVDAVKTKASQCDGLSAVNGSSDHQLPTESVNSRWFYAYLMGVAAQVKRSYQVPLVLIVDNASIHRSKQMVDWRKSFLYKSIQRLCIFYLRIVLS